MPTFVERLQQNIDKRLLQTNYTSGKIYDTQMNYSNLLKNRNG